ncbi:PREDICTED: UPF0496 protein 1-like [Ipomoea nil]|uniref:UPF0496 protein 1-like n=1 Tax=Ipomoea nil TaxID=35883 RepID=UPI000901D5A2|nr:PREDICTED: UPF0496 protein 1-like [Ipomoea nil]
MGNHFCKPRDQNTHFPATSTPSSATISSGFDISTELSSYLMACQKDPGFRAFDSTLQDRATRAINSVAGNLDHRALSVESLRDVTVCFLDMNHEVVNFILESKRDIWKDPDLFDLVKEFLDNSRHTMSFCTALEGCLHRVQTSQSILKFALQKFEEETAQIQGSDPTHLYSQTLQQLQMFKDAGDPFTEKFFSLFHVMYTKQESMLNKLREKKRKLDKKLRRRKSWRRISSAIFATVFVSAIVCSIVAAAVTAPPVVTALAAAAAVPLGTVGKWINNLWRKYENELKKERDILNTVGAWTTFMIKDLDDIQALVDKFKILIEGLLSTADFAMLQSEAVEIAMEDIKKNVNSFMETVEILNVHADNCRQHIRMARTVILRKINNQASSSSSGNGILFD